MIGMDSKCNHIDSELVYNNESILLKPLCGIGSWRDADGYGQISGFSTASHGMFVYDGLVTSPNVWGAPHSHRLRRIRFVTEDTVGPEGDIRAFLLTPHAYESNTTTTTTEASNLFMGDCRNDLGCEESDNELSCACIHVCENDIFSWIVVYDEELQILEAVGTCDNTSGISTLDMDIVRDIQVRLGITPHPPVCDDLNETLVTIEIQMDDHAVEDFNRYELEVAEIEERQWVMMNSKLQFMNKENYIFQECMRIDECYRFTIYDRRGDGICCLDGEGYYRIDFNGKLIKSTVLHCVIV